MQTEWLTCIQCDSEFEFDVSEQLRHVEKGYDLPRRCPACRKHKTKIMNAWEIKKNKTRQKNNYRRDEDNSRRRKCMI
jgi:hypothetical protein